MYACVLTVDLRLPLPDSLKAKRAVITPILEGARRRHRVATSEVGHREVLDAVERFVWSFPEVEVLSTRRGWLEEES